MPIKCITFDLDDTLWECESVIALAERRFYDWLSGQYAAITERYSHAQLVHHRREYFRRYPDMAHDFTWLRKRWLAHLARGCGYGGELVDAGFEVFWTARNDVELFDDVHGLLGRLSKRYRLGAITNGNADVHHIGIGDYFEFVVTAADAGAAKPEARIFELALKHAQAAPSEVVHVGDDPVRDVHGAKAAGMLAVWCNLNRVTWPGGPAADVEITALAELESALLSVGQAP